MNKRGILVVSFGTTYSDTREKTIEAIERELKEQFSDRTFYRAFTSEIVRSVIWEKEGIQIPNVAIALEQMHRDGIQDILVQPTHVIAGMEYDKMIAQIQEKQEWFETIRIGKPLLNETRDYEVAAKAILEETNRNVNWTKHMAVVYMGHGSEHEANQCYPILQKTFRKMGSENIYVSTVEGSPILDETICEIRKNEYHTIVLQPFMIVSGDHARNDMASRQTNSWKSRLEEMGYQTICLLKGLGELEEIRHLFSLHAEEAVGLNE